LLFLNKLGHYLKVANNEVVKRLPQIEGEKVPRSARKSAIRIFGRRAGTLGEHEDSGHRGAPRRFDVLPSIVTAISNTRQCVIVLQNVWLHN
jgi:hypothetical protein